MNDMIGYVSGEVLDGDVVVDSAGVGWQVRTALPLAEGSKVALYVHTDVREDAITLYGFNTRSEREVFQSLRKVPGVGPATALGIIASLGTGGLATAVAQEDAKSVAGVKGVGPKLAAKIVSLVNLPDNVQGESQKDDALAALIALGYDQSSAMEALRTVRAEGCLSEEDSIRAAIRALA